MMEIRRLYYTYNTEKYGVLYEVDDNRKEEINSKRYSRYVCTENILLSYTVHI